MKLNDIRIGALGGTLCSIWVSFSFGDLLQSVLTAAVGTLVSFGTSRLLGKWRKKEKD
ncbi:MULTISPECIES: hypothetical protein [Sphingobacterium]|uniref:hypothetical protein n=1 Tax=Sphingobacterium TaxID=28453 RepID=UPI0010D82782|nr:MULTISPECIES: hypothetical protein [Sphingobacterium]MCW2263141.1 hypothetical protein [Sphingobacterium kitahiroshimense]TCR11876.1 hypothetical protein EDF67_103289 [Sphingobacterium sp. JUb78]